MVEVKVTADEDEDWNWNLSRFAKQVFETQNKTDVGLHFVESEPHAEKALLTAPGEVIDPGPNASENGSLAGETASPLVVARAREAQLSVTRLETKREEGRQFRTANEMVDTILNALRTVDGFPERGFVITVYGMNPWNAMLTIKPEAGRIKHPQQWQERVQEIAVRLRNHFNLIQEQ
jgi:hypothetical protein